jgi:hypothetical protein
MINIIITLNLLAMHYNDNIVVNVLLDNDFFNDHN